MKGKTLPTKSLHGPSEVATALDRQKQFHRYKQLNSIEKLITPYNYKIR
jgi:hypothetical protein